MNSNAKFFLLLVIAVALVTLLALVVPDEKKPQPVKKVEQVQAAPTNDTDDWEEAEVEKLEYGSYLSPELKQSLRSRLRYSDENMSMYAPWYAREKGFSKGYYITVDRTDKVIRIETKIEASASELASE